MLPDPGGAVLPPAASGPPLPGARILVVDDDAAIVRLLRKVLDREGYTRVHGVTDPEDALVLLPAFDPDLVILDLHMPVRDGFSVLARIAETTPPGGFLPVLVLTGDADPGARQRALALGARDFLTKPFEPLEARFRIRNLLHTRQLFLELAAARRGWDA